MIAGSVYTNREGKEEGREGGVGRYLHAHPSPHLAGVEGHDLPKGVFQQLRPSHVQPEGGEGGRGGREG